MEIEFKKLPNKELIQLIRLRLKNEKFTATITRIVITDKWLNTEHFSIRYIIKTKEWADQSCSLIFHKFYLNEWKYLSIISNADA